MLAGGLGLVLLASCGSEARLPAGEFGDQARAVCARANAAVGGLPNPGPSVDDPLPNLVRNLLVWGKDTSLIIFVAPTASPDELASVRRVINGSGGVLRVRFLDQTASKKLFDTIFAGSELVESVPAEELPTSFNLVLLPSVDTDRLVERFSGQAAVQSVRTASETITPLIRPLRAFADRAASIRDRQASQLDDLRPPSGRDDAVDALVEHLRTEAGGLRQVARSAAARDDKTAARLVAAAWSRASRLSAAAARAGLAPCGRSAWTPLMGAGRS